MPKLVAYFCSHAPDDHTIRANQVVAEENLRRISGFCKASGLLGGSVWSCKEPMTRQYYEIKQLSF